MERQYSPNFWPKIDLPVSKIQAVCLHGTAGPFDSAVSWLTSPRSEVSANYVIAKSGRVVELVDPAIARAWANGRVDVYDQTIKWLVDAVKNRINPNWITVSIEHEASEEDMRFHRPMTNAQFNASIDLTAAILTVNGLKADHETIIAHCQICAIAKPICPGVIFVPAYLEVLQKRHPELV